MRDSKSVVKLTEPTESTLHRQRRGVLTRQDLLRSARAVFARDGFENARIEDIAAQAGKTRGAFYANFKDKEDVFFAIFENDLDRDRAELGPLLVALPDVEQRIDALIGYLGELSKNQERILLNLEFKLYAIRHPGERKRLADLHRAMRLRSSIPELTQLLPEGSGQKTHAQLAICSMIDGLTFDHLFDPDALTRDERNHYLRICVRQSFQSSPQPIRRHGKNIP